MLQLRANTAVDVLIGPFVDDTDGKTAETGLTLSQGDIKLSKNGQALTQKNDDTAASHDASGYYNCELDATDTNTEGQLVLIVSESGALPVRHEFNVLSEAAWDSLYAAKDDGYMSVDVAAKAGGKYKIANTTGNWSTAGTWADGVEPVAGDNIIIRDGVTVTLDSGSAITDLGQFGTLEVQGSSALNIDGGVTVAVVPRGWVVGVNNGTITTNYGTVTTNNFVSTITTNYGTVTNNVLATVTTNSGTVTNNNGTVTNNNGTVTNNNGTVAFNTGTVRFNFGTVTTNNSGGIVYGGTVGTNIGTHVIFQTGDCFPTVDTFEFQGNRVKATVPPTHGAIGDNTFQMSVTATPRAGKIVVDGGSSDDGGVQLDDLIKTTTTYTDPTVGTQWDVVVDILQHDPDYDGVATGDPVITLASSDDGIQTIDEAGQTTYISDGVVRFSATSDATDNSPSQTVYTGDLTSETSEPASYDIITYAPHPGSVRENAEDAVDDRIGVVGAELAIFDTQDHATPAYVRNTDNWTQKGTALDLTCISPWNSTGANTRAGTLISSRHILFAKHYPISNGATVRFVKQDNSVVDMTLLSQSNPASDIKVGLLSADVPAGISFAKVLPDDWDDYLPSEYTNAGQGIPTLGLDQQEKAIVTDISTLAGANVSCQVPTDETRLSFYEPKITGDSGNPLFMIVNDELILLTCWWYGGAGSGPSVHNYRSEINAAMAALDTAAGNTPDKTLTSIDLSGFNTY
jgi:hypothetical protein